MEEITDADRTIADQTLIRWGAISQFVQANFGGFSEQSYLGGKIAKALDDLSCLQNVRVAIRELLSVEFVLKQLDDVRKTGHPCFRKLSRSIRKPTAQISDYYGVRFELSIAAKLCRIGIDFAMPDPPDFSLEGEFSGLMVECTGAYLDVVSASNSAKLKAKILDKDQKPYATRNTLLCIDHTNLSYGMASDFERIESDAVWQEVVLKTFDESKFGGLLLLTFMFEEDPLMIHQGYNRFVHQHCSPRLRNFMDSYYPTNKIEIVGSVPPNG